MLMDGIHVPLTVPFARDGRVYSRKLEENVRRYSLGPAAGLVALAPGFEGGSLSDAESADVLRVVGQSATAEKVLIAGVCRESVAGALALCRVAAEAGFDAVLLSAPVSWPLLGREELGVYFRMIADASPLAVMLRSEAAAPAMPLPVEMVAELAGHPNVLGIYDAELTVERLRELAETTSGVRREVEVTTVFAPVTRRMKAAGEVAEGMVSAVALGGGTAVLTAPAKPGLKTRQKTVGFQVMGAGSCSGLLELLQTGAAGSMPRLAACAPQGCYEVYAAFKDGDAGLSAEKALRLVEADALMAAMGIAGVKYGCDWNGYFGGSARLPKLPLRGDEREMVERVLREVRN